MGRLERLQFIIDQVARNPSITAEESDALVYERARPGLEATRRGEEAVINVISTLEALEDVRKVTETRKYGSRDKNDLDIKIEMEPRGRYGSLGHTWGQVKSSWGYIDRFMRRFGSSMQEIEDELARRKHLVFHGHVTRQDIEASFYRQMDGVMEVKRRKWGWRR